MKRLRMIVTGKEGQVVQSLLERAAGNTRFEVIALGRPNLDLSAPETISPIIGAARPDVIVSAAAYTAVDQAETEETEATIINGVAVGKIAEVASALDIPLLHLSTDYVFDGHKDRPYVEMDLVAPASAYGRSKLAGEQAITAATANYAILRTAWVYSPFGKNFLKTMLRLAETRDSINVVDDQVGNPTCALDIADAVFTTAGNLVDSEDSNLRGVFHMSGSGEASWADFATEIFARSALSGGPSAEVGRIPTSSYPTPAKRPANSRLDCTRLQDRHGVRLPDWKISTAQTVERLIRKHSNDGTIL